MIVLPERSQKLLPKHQKDSDCIFKQITNSDLTKDEATLYITQMFIPDMSISRAGISHATKRLDKYYKDK